LNTETREQRNIPLRADDGLFISEAYTLKMFQICGDTKVMSQQKSTRLILDYSIILFGRYRFYRVGCNCPMIMNGERINVSKQNVLFQR